MSEVYRERAQLVAFVASLFPSVIAYSDPDEPNWPVIYITSPAGQMSWHLHKDDLELFAHVPMAQADDPHAQWDGHSSEEKYRRLAALVSIRQLLSTPVQVLSTPVQVIGPSAGSTS